MTQARGRHDRPPEVGPDGGPTASATRGRPRRLPPVPGQGPRRCARRARPPPEGPALRPTRPPARAGSRSGHRCKHAGGEGSSARARCPDLPEPREFLINRDGVRAELGSTSPQGRRRLLDEPLDPDHLLTKLQERLLWRSAHRMRFANRPASSASRQPQEGLVRLSMDETGESAQPPARFKGGLYSRSNAASSSDAFPTEPQATQATSQEATHEFTRSTCSGVKTVGRLRAAATVPAPRCSRTFLLNADRERSISVLRCVLSRVFKFVAFPTYVASPSRNHT